MLLAPTRDLALVRLRSHIAPLGIIVRIVRHRIGRPDVETPEYVSHGDEEVIRREVRPRADAPTPAEGAVPHH